MSWSCAAASFKLAAASGSHVPEVLMRQLSIGGTLVMEGFGQEVHKGYIYFAMAFSSVVEILNIRLRRKAATKVELHQPYR